MVAKKATKPRGIDDLQEVPDLSRDPELRAVAELGPDALRRRWRSLVGGPIPEGLGRSLVLRILAYRSQAQRFGDLDLVSQRALSASPVGRTDVSDVVADPSSVDVSKGIGQGAARDDNGKGAPKAMRPGISIASPGTVLVRQHAGSMHRVMVLDDGFAWNGKTYESLSKVAFAITGTQWNGPRFFGLRAKQILPRQPEERRP
jgi:hypothetical protein